MAEDTTSAVNSGPEAQQVGALHGLLLLDKPTGITSNRALQQVKRALGVKKAGHTGTLDPLASGVLPICLGEATKFSQYLLTADKCYQVTAKLGERTTTGDCEGEMITQRPITDIGQAELTRILPQFRGQIEQIPSMFSALKYRGQPLYKLARQGIEVERPPRQVDIYQLDQLHWENGLLSLYVHCSKGTYIRNLVDDMGEKLGCGAHVVALRRTAVAQFDQQHSQALDSFLQQCAAPTVISLNEMLTQYPAIILTRAEIQQIYQGKQLTVTSGATGLVRLHNQQGEFVGMAEIDAAKQLKSKRLLNNKNINL